MGAFRGSLTYRQYFVRDPLPGDWKDRFQIGIEQNLFQPLDPAGEAERSVGWCSIHFPLDLELTPEQYIYNEYIVLGLRIDTLTVPGSLLRIFTESECRKVMFEQKKNKLSRYEKAEIKDRVKLDLKKRLLPAIKSIDVAWNWQKGVLRFFAGNEKVNVEFMELFEQSFGLQLTPDGPYTGALLEATGLTDDELRAIDGLEPVQFVDLDTAVAAMKE